MRVILRVAGGNRPDRLLTSITEVERALKQGLPGKVLREQVISEQYWVDN